MTPDNAQKHIKAARLFTAIGSLPGDRPIITLFLLGLGAGLSLIFFGFPLTSDTALVAKTYQHFSGALFSGSPYPRWLEGFYNGFGAPVFYYYTPLFFYFTALADIATLTLLPDAQVLGIAAAGLLILSGLTAYLWLNYFLPSPAALGGAVFYMLAPYHWLVDLFVRGAVTELTAYLWLPLIFLYFHKSLAGTGSYSPLKLALTYSLLILSCIPAALALSPFFLLYAVVFLYAPKGKKTQSPAMNTAKKFGLTVGGLALGVGLASFYLLPAYILQDDIMASRFATGRFDPGSWFLCFLCEKSPEPFFSRLLSGLAIIQIGLIALFFHRLNQKSKKTSLLTVPVLVTERGFWMVASLIALFLMTGASAKIWEVMPLAQYIQFPWRLMIIADLALAALLAQLISTFTFKSYITREHIIFLAAILIFPFFYKSALFPPYRLNPLPEHNIYEQDTYLGSYFPKEVAASLSDILTYPPSQAPDPLANAEDFLFDHKTGAGLLAYTPEIPVRSEAPVSIHIRQFAYPVWRAYSTTTGEALPLRPGKPLGEIVIDHPGGEDVISLRRERTAAERYGLILSLFSGLIWLGAAAFIRCRHPARRESVK